MNKKGFTLIELLIVVAIISILSAMGLFFYSGLIEKTERNACLHQYQEIKNIISLKFVEANSAMGPGIEFSSGNCFQHFLPSNSTTGDIATEMSKNASQPTLCNHTPQSHHTYYFDHLYGLGFRNCSNFGTHPYASCSGNDCPAMATYGRIWNGVNAHVKGQVIFACGTLAGLSDPNKCYIGAKITDNEIVENYISK